MDYSDRPEIIDKINHFASCNESFLFAVDFHGKKGFVLSPEEADKAGILYDIEGNCNTPPPVSGNSFTFGFFPPEFREYQAAFEKVLFHLNNGNTYLLNLTFPAKLKINLSLREIFLRSSARFRLFVPDQFAVFSPESFIEINGNEILTRPMKGTISANIPEAEKVLMEDKKELFEHNTIVDLLRNDLSMVSTGVNVRKFRYLEKIHTNREDLWQMSSEISGTLPGDYLSKLGQTIFKLLPAGSVTGAPKESTVRIIRETENYDRGFYTGIFGYFDGQSLKSAVSIRFIEKAGRDLIFKSGGGITALSDMQSEYDELIAKIYVPVV